MPDAATMIAVIGGAVGLVGGGGGLVGLWSVWRREHREEAHAFFASYEKSIATLQTQYQRETDAAKKEEKTQRLEAVENEYLEQQEAYRQNKALRESAPRGVLPAEGRALPEAAATELTNLLRAASRLSPALLTAQDHLVRGNVLFELKRYEEALEEYSRSLELVPDDPAILNNRGGSLRHLKRYDEALADYNRALELRPDDPAVFNNRGVALDDLQRYDEALADYNRSLALRPDHPDTLNNRGVTLQHLKRYEEALADYERSLELQPDGPATLYNRACAFSLMDRYEDALADLSGPIAHDAKYRPMAREDEDFEGLRNDPQWGPKFRELVETEE